MAFITREIQASSTNTEIQFVQRIIDLITGIDPRITCNTTAAQQYADLTSASRATFDIDIDGKFQIRLKRSATNNTQTAQYIYSIIVNGNEYKISNAARWWTTNTIGTGTVSNGFFRVSAFITENVIFLWFGSNYGTNVSIFPTSNPYSVGLIKDDNNNSFCNGVWNSTNIEDTPFYKCSDGTANYLLVKPLNYTEGAGTIAYIDKNPISSDGAFSSFAKDILACSTVALGASVALPNGKNYFAIGTNIMCEITS